MWSLAFMTAASDSKNEFVSPSISACARLEKPMYRSTAGSSDAVDLWLGVCNACLGALVTSAGQPLKMHYFDTAPLLSSRLLQLTAYASSLALPAREQLQKRAEILAARLAALAEGMSRDQVVPRSAEVTEAMSEALGRHSYCRRSGRPLDWTNSKENSQTAARAADANSSLHMHLHLTNHGGTTLLGILQTQTCNLISAHCAAIVTPEVAAGRNRKSTSASSRGEALESKRRDSEARLLAITANASARNGHCCSSTCGGYSPAYAQGSQPIDVGFFEPALVDGAPVTSNRIVWTTIIRHPAVFALGHGDFIPEFMLSSWLGQSASTSNGLGPKHTGGWHCDLPSLESLRTHGPNQTTETKTHKRQTTVALGEPRRAVEDRGSPARYVQGNCKAGQPNLTRTDLAHAKQLAQSFTIISTLEEYNEGALAFCELLGWPTCQPVKRWAPKGLGPNQTDLSEASHRSSSSAHRIMAGTVHHSVDMMLSSNGYGPDLRALVWSDIIDASQLSTELYYYGRELNRASHLKLGLRPPTAGLLPVGEA